jgi:hypothetical protein
MRHARGHVQEHIGAMRICCRRPARRTPPPDSTKDELGEVVVPQPRRREAGCVAALDHRHAEFRQRHLNRLAARTLQSLGSIKPPMASAVFVRSSERRGDLLLLVPSRAPGADAPPPGTSSIVREIGLQKVRHPPLPKVTCSVSSDQSWSAKSCDRGSPSSSYFFTRAALCAA